MLGIMASLFSNLASESQARIRLLAKYVETNYEKVDRLLEIREHSENRLTVAKQEIEQERRVSCAAFLSLVVWETEGPLF